MNFTLQSILFLLFIIFVYYLYNRFGKNEIENRSSNTKILTIILTGLFSLTFFLGELGLLYKYNSTIFATIATNPESRLVKQQGWRFFYHQTANLLKENENSNQRLYIFGGSSAREYFPPDEVVSRKLAIPVLNMGSPSQQLVDTIRIVDQIEKPGSVVVYIFRPGKFTAFDEQKLSNVNYLNGTDYPYFLHSDRVTLLMQNYKKIYGPHKTEVSVSYRLAALLNPYIYTLNENLTFLKRKWHRTGLENLFKDTRPMEQNREKYRNKVLKTLTKNQESKKDSEHIRHATATPPSRSVEISFYFLEQLYLLCEKKGLKFIILDLPKPNNDPTVLSKMQELEHRYKDIIHIKIPAKMMTNYRGYFADVNHLNDKGRAYYLPYLIKSLKPHLSN